MRYSSHSDVTVHFGSSAFHVHSVTLKKNSKVLAAAVDGADNKDCCLTEACKKSAHRCFSLNSPFGTTVVDEIQLQSFFDHIYNPLRLFETPAFSAPLGGDGKPIMLGHAVLSTGKAWGGGVVTGYPSNQIEVTKCDKLYSVPASLIHTTPTFKPFQLIGLQHFLYVSEVIIRLCHFFDCESSLQSFKNYLGCILDDANSRKEQKDMFVLLSLCDHCHFDSLVQPIALWLLLTKADLGNQGWLDLVKSLRAETIAEVMRLAVSNKSK